MRGGAGPVADQPDRPRTPPGVGTPLRAVGLPGRRHPLEERNLRSFEWGSRGEGRTIESRLALA
jgi:hypothetical protein